MGDFPGRKNQEMIDSSVFFWGRGLGGVAWGAGGVLAGLGDAFGFGLLLGLLLVVVLLGRMELVEENGED